MSTEMPPDQRVSPSRVKQSPTPPRASFPNLPPELRSMIWEAVCIPFAEKDGVHYIDIDKIEEESQNRGSLYSRDIGLWNVCRESRRAIAAHYHLDLWLLAQYQPLDSIEMQCAIKATRKKNARPVTSVDNDFLTVAFGPFDEHSEVQPTHHRLCVRTSSPEFLMPRLKRLNLYLPMVKSLKKISLVRYWKLAFDKDRSFNYPRPRSWRKLMSETSQRSLWYRCQSALWDGKVGLDCPVVLLDKIRSYLVRDRTYSTIGLEDECYFKIRTFESVSVTGRSEYCDMIALWHDSSIAHAIHINEAYPNRFDVYVPCSSRLIPLQGN
ncbi:hypothetical protein NW768_007723 [Fusarium equiseti]|uniref:2EXR domain-containing protein n=1 Tax=Fusarium equiseti TaxID=61235 RepID=A0ABQ8R8L7_FUSEQ|nr:hypothetical protein NW768_007723 [Fusarium equiseti]